MSSTSGSAEGVATSSQPEPAQNTQQNPSVESPAEAQALVPFSLPKDGRSIRTLPNGFNCTAEKRLIAAHYAFHGKLKRPLAEALAALGVGRTALYRWKSEYEDLVNSAKPPAAALKQHIDELKGRTDAENLARFLDLSPAVNSPNASGTDPITRAIDLGQAANEGDGDDPLSPGQLPMNVLNNILLTGGADLPTEEESSALGVEVDDDLNEEGEALVHKSINNAIALHMSSQRPSTQNIWKGPQQKFMAFFRGLARLRAGEKEKSTVQGEKGQSTVEGDKGKSTVETEVLVTEQKMVTFLK
ncbi:hypothetical protein V8E36_003149 [Tilletia maclaganii]